jgi:4-amino-4-deoxy-L-arabinose transferase-like glycosyltransferase
MQLRMKWKFPALNFTPAEWIILVACSIPAFYMLGTPAIYIWDEAVYTNASLDMVNGSSWWVPVHGEYNTKPPLVLWLQSICLAIVPSPEWAVRFPSALAVPGIMIVLMMGLKRWGFDFTSRLLVMVCFVGHEGFIRHHISRTGDLDAVMTFFVVAYTMVVLDAIRQNKWTGRHMFFFFLGVVCAFYAKSIGGWLMLGPLVIVWLLTPLRSVLFSVRFWLGALLSLGICLLYYFTREMIQPGFLDLVWHSEYQRMFQNVMPWHEHPAGYYFNNFTLLRTYTPWIYMLVVFVLFSLLFLQDRLLKLQLVHWIILAFGYMMVITIPAVKLEWYDAPAYPFFAMIMGVVAGYFLLMTASRWKLLVFIPVVFILWRKMVFTSSDIFPKHPFEFEGAMLRQIEPNEKTKVFMEVETPEHRLQLDFYRKIIAKERGLDIPVVETIAEISTGDHLIISQEEPVKTIQTEYLLDRFKIWPGLGYEITIGPKKEIVR